MQAAIRAANSTIRKNESYIRLFKNAVYWVAQNIDDYEKLKMSVLAELKTYVEDHHQKVMVEDNEIQQETKVQMTFLKKSVDALHNKLKREQDEHVRSRIAVMETNHKLINEITGENGLKTRINALTEEFKNAGSSNKLREIKKKLQEREKMLE